MVVHMAQWLESVWGGGGLTIVPSADRLFGPYRPYEPDLVTSRPLTMPREANHAAAVAERAVRELATGPGAQPWKASHASCCGPRPSQARSSKALHPRPSRSRWPSWLRTRTSAGSAIRRDSSRTTSPFYDGQVRCRRRRTDRRPSPRHAVPGVDEDPAGPVPPYTAAVSEPWAGPSRTRAWRGRPAGPPAATSSARTAAG